MHEVVRKQIVAAVQAGHERRHQTGISFDELPDFVTESAVPLGPSQRGQVPSQVIGACGIPGFGDQADVRQVGVGGDIGEQWRNIPVE